MANREVLYKFAFVDGDIRPYYAWDTTEEENRRYKDAFYRTIDGIKTNMVLVHNTNNTVFFRRNPNRIFPSSKESVETYETELHKAAKAIFVKNWQKISIHVPNKVKCPVCDFCPDFDQGSCVYYSNDDIGIKLSDMFKEQPVIEKTTCKGGFVPDILFSDSHGEELWIEVNNTHKVEKEKVWKGVPILEIDVKDDNDIEWLYKHRNFYDGGKSHLFNMWAFANVKKQYCNELSFKYENIRVLYRAGDLGLGINDSWPYKKHMGETVLSVYKIDRPYFDWCINNTELLNRLSKNCKKRLELNG